MRLSITKMKRAIALVAGYYAATDAVITTLLWTDKRNSSHTIRMRDSFYLVNQNGKIINKDSPSYLHNNKNPPYNIDPNHPNFIKPISGLTNYTTHINPDPSAAELTDTQYWFKTWRECNITRMLYDSIKEYGTNSPE